MDGPITCRAHYAQNPSDRSARLPIVMRDVAETVAGVLSGVNHYVRETCR
jgi:hypothetical protein